MSRHTKRCLSGIQTHITIRIINYYRSILVSEVMSEPYVIIRLHVCDDHLDTAIMVSDTLRSTWTNKRFQSELLFFFCQKVDFPFSEEHPDHRVECIMYDCPYNACAVITLYPCVFACVRVMYTAHTNHAQEIRYYDFFVS